MPRATSRAIAPGGDHLERGTHLVTEAHHRPLAEGLLDVGEGGVEGLLAVCCSHVCGAFLIGSGRCSFDAREGHRHRVRAHGRLWRTPPASHLWTGTYRTDVRSPSRHAGVPLGSGGMEPQHLERRLRELCAAHDVPGASVAVLVGRRDGHGRHGRAQPGHRRRGDDRQPLPDRLDHQALHGQPGHAVRRARPARPGRAGGDVPARAPGRRTRPRPGRSPCGTCCRTPAASTATTSSTPAAATTSSSGTSPRARRWPSSSRSARPCPTATPGSASPAACWRR